MGYDKWQNITSIGKSIRLFQTIISKLANNVANLLTKDTFIRNQPKKHKVLQNDLSIITIAGEKGH